MGARKLLLRWYVRLTRGLPDWLKTRRARIIALAGAGLFIVSVVADVGGVFNVFFPGPKAATSQDIDTLRAMLVEEMRAQGFIVDAPAQSAFDEGVDFFEKLGDPRARRAVELLAAADSGRALGLFTLIAEEQAKSPDREKSARAYDALGAIAYTIDRRAALAAYEAAKALTPDDPYINFRLGTLYQDFGELEKAKAANEQAIKRAVDEESAWIAPVAIMHNGLIAKTLGDLDGAREAILGAAKTFDATGDRSNLAIAYLNLGGVYATSLSGLNGESRDLSAAEEHYLAALQIGYELRDPDIVASAQLGLGGVEQSRGAALRAVELFGRALAHAEWIGAPDTIAQARLRIGVSAMLAQDYPAAISQFNIAQQVYADLGNAAGLATTKMALGSAYGAGGDMLNGCREIDEGLAIFRRIGATPYADQVAAAKADACDGGQTTGSEWLEDLPLPDQSWSPYDALGESLDQFGAENQQPENLTPPD